MKSVVAVTSHCVGSRVVDEELSSPAHSRQDEQRAAKNGGRAKPPVAIHQTAQSAATSRSNSARFAF